MVAFPDVGHKNPHEQSLIFKTLTSQFENEGESSKQKWLFPKRNFPIKFENLYADTEARPIWQFFIARKGRHEPFSFFSPFPDQYISEYVGTADGSTLIYNMPVKNGSSIAIYVGGTLQTETTDYTIDTGGGADGEDKLTLVSGHTDGDYITCDFTGTLKVRCKFDEDIMSWQDFYGRIVNAGIRIKGLLNA